MHRDLVDLHVLLDHHLLEADEVVHGEDLLHDAIVRRVFGTLLTRCLEPLSCDAHFCDELAEQLVHKFEEFLITEHRLSVRKRVTLT